MYSGEKEADADKSLKMSNNHWNCCVAGCLSNHRHEKMTHHCIALGSQRGTDLHIKRFVKLMMSIGIEQGYVVSIGVSQVSEGENVDSMCFRI